MQFAIICWFKLFFFSSFKRNRFRPNEQNTAPTIRNFDSSSLPFDWPFVQLRTHKMRLKQLVWTMVRHNRVSAVNISSFRHTNSHSFLICSLTRSLAYPIAISHNILHKNSNNFGWFMHMRFVFFSSLDMCSFPIASKLDFVDAALFHRTDCSLILSSSVNRWGEKNAVYWKSHRHGIVSIHVCNRCVITHYQ